MTNKKWEHNSDKLDNRNGKETKTDRKPLKMMEKLEEFHEKWPTATDNKCNVIKRRVGSGLVSSYS